jgi:hypothetical protein
LPEHESDNPMTSYRVCSLRLALVCAWALSLAVVAPSQLRAQAAAPPAAPAPAPAPELSLQGYFTSEIGYTQAMRYLETPGAFEPCVPYAPGDRAWAPHA